MIAENSTLNPYPGPRPFEQGEQNLFFGREREVKELLALIIAHRVVVLYAQSGAGKTSLLNAGLAPLLTEEGFEILPVARVRGFEPEDIDLSDIANIYVFNTLVGWSEDKVEPAPLMHKSIVSFLEEREHHEDEFGDSLPRLAIFDQFEELFTFYPERWKEREDFFRQVVDALEADPLLRVLFVMREDYLASLVSYNRLFAERLRARYRMERLRQEAATMAVEKPLRGTGRSFAEGVASSLVQELLSIHVESAPGQTVQIPGEYVEPVQLQVVCQSLWESLPADVTVINAQHLQIFGDVGEALKGFYERTLEAAQSETDAGEGDLREWFDKELITPAGTRGTVFRGEERTGKIPNSAVDVLEDQHIIRAEMRAGGRWYELTHDRLIEPIRKSNEIWSQEEQQRQTAERDRTARRVFRSRSLGVLRYLTAAFVAISLLALGSVGSVIYTLITLVRRLTTDIGAMIKITPSVLWFFFVVFVLLPLFYRPIRYGLWPKLIGFTGLEFALVTDSINAAIELAERSSHWEFKVSSVEKKQVLRRVKRCLTLFEDAQFLWVDDHPESNLKEREMFRRLNVRIDIVKSSAEALDILKSGRYDVIFSDMARGENAAAGLEFLEQFRMTDKTTPVIFYIGVFDPEKGTPAKAFGITNRPDELLHLTLDALERKKY